MVQYSALPTPEQIQTLLNFLPVFQAEDFQPVREWIIGEPDEEGVIHLPYPVYHPAVEDFFRLAGQPAWSDYGYRPGVTARRIADPEFLRNADLESLKTLLTYCVRGERFCDGHWASLFRNGTLVRLLQRLEQLV